MEVLLRDFLDDEHRSRFDFLYRFCKENRDFLYDFFNKCPFFVDHGWRHVENVLSILDALLLPKFIEDPNYLSSNELFYLLCAALLHDIGLGYRGELSREDEELTRDILDECLKIRKIHGRLSARMIEEMREFKPFLGDDAFIVAKIVQYHQSKSPLTRGHMEKLGEKSLERTWIEREVKDSSGETVRVRLLAAYLRLADAIDINQKRVSPYQKYQELETVLEREVKALKSNIEKRLRLLAKLRKIRGKDMKIFKEVLDTITEKSISEDYFSALKMRVEGKIREHLKREKEDEVKDFIKEILKLLKKLELLKYQYKHYRKHKSIAQIIFPKNSNKILLLLSPKYDYEGLKVAKEEIQKEINTVKNVIGTTYEVITQLEKDKFPENYIDIREWYSNKRSKTMRESIREAPQKQTPIQLIEEQVEKIGEDVKIKLTFKALEDNIELTGLIGIIKGKVKYLSPYLKEMQEDIIFEPSIKLNKNETFTCQIIQTDIRENETQIRIRIKRNNTYIEYKLEEIKQVPTQN